MSNATHVSEYRAFGDIKQVERNLSAANIPIKITEVALLDSRAEGKKISVAIGNDDVVAVALEDGFTLWIRGSDLRDELGEETRDGTLTLRRHYGRDEDQRGLGGWLIKGLRIFGFDPVEKLVSIAAEAVEPKGGNALLRLDPAAPLPNAEKAWQTLTDELPAPEDGEPLLLFVHGTFSSTLGSFGELFRAPGPASSLRSRYPGRIYGFEHRTLTESPVANALALVERLPRNARLHLVSHSRGGLVADLLCLTPLADRPDLLSEPYLQHLSPDDRRDLPRLIEQVREKRLLSVFERAAVDLDRGESDPLDPFIPAVVADRHAAADRLQRPADRGHLPELRRLVQGDPQTCGRLRA